MCVCVGGGGGCQKEGGTRGGRGERGGNSNSKTVIFKDSSVRSIWTYLTASPCHCTNTSKHDDTTNIYVSVRISSVMYFDVLQFHRVSYKCAEREGERDP